MYIGLKSGAKSYYSQFDKAEILTEISESVIADYDCVLNLEDNLEEFDTGIKKYFFIVPSIYGSRCNYCGFIKANNSIGADITLKAIIRKHPNKNTLCNNPQLYEMN